MRDEIYRSVDAGSNNQDDAAPAASVAPFRFNETVAHVFHDMINRSVPGYSLMLELITLLAGRHAGQGARCYDLGCSLGASALAIAQGMKRHGNDKTARIVGLDNSAAMLTRCRQNVLRDAEAAAMIELLEADICEHRYEPSEFIVSNFTLQFVPPEKRPALLGRLYDSLQPGGAFFLAEKIRYDDSEVDRLMIEIHERFKRSRGYSELEIAAKRAALEAVLLPESSETHISRLKDAGFSQVTECFRCLNFSAFLAIR
ncbi:carboxy-S-adenosyl-L-methionine synthase CmoA [Allohahella marinimesophila]|uniref:Carboxy-S-adenosyl-L-methionine synthase n=1 Tax=Allohahella marinimesophila TaxID=1054972 RepID=A0ABP7NPD7_9GAMM